MKLLEFAVQDLDTKNICQPNLSKTPTQSLQQCGGLSFLNEHFYEANLKIHSIRTEFRQRDAIDLKGRPETFWNVGVARV